MKKLAIRLIRFYQKTAFFRHPLLKALFLSDLPAGRQVLGCRFQPTCSEYSLQAIEKYGIIRGCLLSLKRIIRCHPWSKGGKDFLK